MTRDPNSMHSDAPPVVDVAGHVLDDENAGITGSLQLRLGIEMWGLWVVLVIIGGAAVVVSELLSR